MEMDMDMGAELLDGPAVAEVEGTARKVGLASIA